MHDYMQKRHEMHSPYLRRYGLNEWIERNNTTLLKAYI